MGLYEEVTSTMAALMSLARARHMDELPEGHLQSVQDVFVGEGFLLPGPVEYSWELEFAYARFLQKYRPIPVQAYMTSVPEDLGPTLDLVERLGLSGINFMLSSHGSAISGVWERSVDLSRLARMAEALFERGVALCHTSWFYPSIPYVEEMLGTIEYLDTVLGGVVRADLDLEGPFINASVGRQEKIDAIALFMREAGRSGRPCVSLSSFPALVRPGGGFVVRDGTVIDSSDNDALDPVQLLAYEHEVSLGLSPQLYSVQPGYKGRSNPIYTPGIMQQYGHDRWEIPQRRSVGVQYRPALPLYEQRGRPGWSLEKHLAVAWSEVIIRQAPDSIEMWRLEVAQADPDVQRFLEKIVSP